MTEETLRAIEAALAQREDVEWFDPARRGIDAALIGGIPDLVAAVRRLKASAPDEVTNQ